MRLNGRRASEFLLHGTAAATFGVPVAFVSGDQGLSEHVKTVNPRIHTLATSRGVGPSTVSLAPAKAQADIEQGVADALRDDRATMKLPLADRWVLEVVYADPVNAYAMSHYPGTRHTGNRTVRFETDTYLDVLRALLFIA